MRDKVTRFPKGSVGATPKGFLGENMTKPSTTLSQISDPHRRGSATYAKILFPLIGGSAAVTAFITIGKPLPLPEPPPSVPRCSYSGRVLERVSRQPIHGVHLLLVSYGAPLEDTTDTNGTFLFPNVRCADTFRIEITDPRYVAFDSYLSISMNNKFQDIELEKMPVSPADVVPASPRSQPQPPPPRSQLPPQSRPQRQYVDRCAFTAEQLGITSLPERTEGFRVTCKGMEPGAIVEISASGPVRAVNQGLNPNNTGAWIVAHITGAEGQGVKQSVSPLPNDGDFPLTGTAKVPPSGVVSTSVVVEHVQTWPNEHGPLHFGPTYKVVIRRF